MRNDPFDLDNDLAYQGWRTRKLDGYPQQATDLVVPVADPRFLTRTEHEAIIALCYKANMCIYASGTGDNTDKGIPMTLAAQFGLRNLDRNIGADDDGITSLQVMKDRLHNRYIPYSNRPIHWHTDGYYNPPDRQIRSLLLHCVRPARQGGENALMDHEIAYIRLRDENPAYIEALMAPDVMTLPANIVDGVESRPARSGPVFSVTEAGRLHMRYTARTHSIEWKQDAGTRAAVTALENLLASDDPFIYRLTLQAGWGLISNNVLHDRSGFNDEEEGPRLLYRMRYAESINRI